MLSHAALIRNRKDFPWLKISIFFALLSVGGTHFLRSGLEPGEIILPWDYPFLLIISSLFSSIALGLYVLRKPHEFHLNVFLFMLFSSSVSCLGWSVLDEMSMVFVSFALLFIMTRGIHRFNSTTKDTLTLFLYLALLLIFFLTSISGFILWGEIKAIRFVLLFFSLLVFSWNLIFYTWQIPAKRDIFSAFLKWGAIYYFLIIGLGFLQIFVDPSFLFSNFRGLGGASAMGALFPGIVLVPVSFYVINSSTYDDFRPLAFSNLFLFFLCSLLMDARAGYLIIFMSMVMLPFAEGIRRTFYIVVSSLGIVVATSTIFLQHPLWILDAVESSVGAFSIEKGTTVHAYYGQDYVDAKGDIGRYMFTYCAYKTAASSPFTYLIGVGSYGFFENLGPCIEAFKAEYRLPDYDRNTGLGGGMPRPPALGAWIIENGILALLLLILVLVSTVSSNFLKKIGQKLVINERKNLHFLPCILIIPAWAYFAEYQDSVFLYFLFMPFGLMYVLTRSR